jgi:glycosyltransferase involved in cell wall biosynthesis
MNINKLILVDPILRGSRLQNTFYFSRAFCNISDKITIVTRKDYKSRHLDELGLSKINNVMFEQSKLDLNGAWIKILNVKELKKVIKQIRTSSILSNEGCITVFFTALDDYFLSLLFFMGFLRKKKSYRFIFMKYRTSFFYETSEDLFKKLKQLLQKFLFSLIVTPDDILLSMDEKLFEYYEKKKLAPRRSYFIYEPWEGNYNGDKVEGRKITGWLKTDFVLMTIGKQDKRKGLSEFLDVFSNVFQLSNIKLHIVGKMPEEVRAEILSKLKEIPENKYKLEEEFIAEEILPFYFSSADVIILPYTKDFKFSSGVLVRAAASGVPVLATSHGLIGYRVKKYGLGLIYDYGNLKDAVTCLNELYSNYNFYKDNVKRNGHEYAHNGYIDNFIKSLHKIITEN